MPSTGATHVPGVIVIRAPGTRRSRRSAGHVPGPVRAGASRWDDGRTPIHPLSMGERVRRSATPARYRSPRGTIRPGARRRRRGGRRDRGRAARRGGVAGGDLPFAFVRKPGYRGHETDEPPFRARTFTGRRVLRVDDAVSSGSAVERYTAALAGVGAEVVGLFVLVDMREVMATVTSVAAALPHRVGGYVPAGPGPRDRHGLLDPGPTRPQRRRDRPPVDGRRPALGPPVASGMRTAALISETRTRDAESRASCGAFPCAEEDSNTSAALQCDREALRPEVDRAGPRRSSSSAPPADLGGHGAIPRRGHRPSRRGTASSTNGQLMACSERSGTSRRRTQGRFGFSARPVRYPSDPRVPACNSGSRPALPPGIRPRQA